MSQMLKAQFFIRENNLVIRFQGELDQHYIEKMRVKVTELISNYKIKFLSINCSELDFIDSSGVGFILGRYNQIKSANGEIVLCEMSEFIERIIRISGLVRICKIKRTEQEAMIYVEGQNGKIYQNAI